MHFAMLWKLLYSENSHKLQVYMKDKLRVGIMFMRISKNKICRMGELRTCSHKQPIYISVISRELVIEGSKWEDNIK
jgi:hypothetical protein